MPSINWKKRFEKAVTQAEKWDNVATDQNEGDPGHQLLWQMGELVFNYLDQARYERLQRPKMGYKCLCADLNNTLGRAEMFLHLTRMYLTQAGK